MTELTHGLSIEQLEHLIARRRDVTLAEAAYNSAKSTAALAKKDWDEARELFEAAFDKAASGREEPSLPFDGIHQSDVDQNIVKANLLHERLRETAKLEIPVATILTWTDDQHVAAVTYLDDLENVTAEAEPRQPPPFLLETPTPETHEEGGEAF